MDEIAALEFLKGHDFSKLGKQYEVRLCTDKQYGMAKVDYKNNFEVEIPFTKKQNDEMFLIG